MMLRKETSQDAFRPPSLSLGIAGLKAIAAWKLYQYGSLGVDAAMFASIGMGAWTCKSVFRALNDQLKVKEYRRKRRKFKEAAKQHGTAAFATEQQIEEAGLFSEGGILLGSIPTRKRNVRDVRYTHGCSGFVLGPPGSHKTTSVFISTLLSTPRSAPGNWIVNDPSGEIYAITHKFRRSLGDVVVLCPWAEEMSGYLRTEIRDAGLDFFAGLDLENKSGSLSDDLKFRSYLAIPRTRDSRNSKTEFFNRGGRSIIQALALIDCSEGITPSFASIQDRLMAGLAELETTLENASESGFCQGLLAKISSSLLGTMSAKDQFAGYFGCAEQAIEIYDPNSSAGKHVSGSGFDPRCIKSDRPLTIYVITPGGRSETHQQLTNATWRYLLQSVISDPRNVPVTALIDECATSLGYIDGFLNFINTGRKHGLSIAGGFQEVFGQMSDLYGQAGVRQLMAAADFIWASGIRDPETCELLSKLCGTRALEDMGLNNRAAQQSLLPEQSHNLSHKSVPLLRPDEIRTFPSEEALVFYRNLNPIKVRKVPYFTCPEWLQRAGKHPFH